MTTSEVQTTVSSEAFFRLPRGAQLLIAYALLNDLWDMRLMRNDPDMHSLKAHGWLVCKVTTTVGVLHCQFPEAVWNGLEGIEEAVLGSISEDEMERFKARKSKAYPWLW